MTRAEATAIARESAYKHGRHHSYVWQAHPNDFEPHEWVIEAILEAVNRQSYGMGGQEKAP